MHLIMNLLVYCFNSSLTMINFGENNISLEMKLTTCFFYQDSTVYDYENSSMTILNCLI